MEKEPELIGFKGVTGGSVGVEEGLMIFDVVFHPTAGTIDGTTEEGWLTALQAGHHKAEIIALIRNFHFAHDLPGLCPGVGLIEKGGFVA